MSKMKSSVLLTAILWWSASIGAAELPEDSSAIHTGVATCATSQCHGSAVPRDATGILQNEYVTWTQSDPHAGAYSTLGNEQSQRMAARLGIGDARKSEECLGCHTDNVPADRRGEKFQLSDGVGCEACHGGAENWLATHYNSATQTRADNLAAGMYPTNEASERAQLCLSCHLGTDDKFATHRMMAAGHPRLAFELDTFSEIWRTLGRQPHFRNDADYRERKTVPDHSYTWAVGLLAEAQLRLDLIAGSHFDGTGMFPELGFYDCHACHRSMKQVQWQRLPRHGAADPGMPFINDGTFVMSLALARVLRPDMLDEMFAALQHLHGAGSESVPAVRAAAAALKEQLVRLQSGGDAAAHKQITKHRFSKQYLRPGADGNYLDYVSAEQAFMAVQMLVIELGDADLEASAGRAGRVRSTTTNAIDRSSLPALLEDVSHQVNKKGSEP